MMKEVNFEPESDRIYKLYIKGDYTKETAINRLLAIYSKKHTTLENRRVGKYLKKLGANSKEVYHILEDLALKGIFVWYAFRKLFPERELDRLKLQARVGPLKSRRLYIKFLEKKINLKNLEVGLIKVVDTEEDKIERIISIDFMIRAKISSENVFNLLENLVISDTHEEIKLWGVRGLIKLFPEQARNPIKWFLDCADDDFKSAITYEISKSGIENLMDLNL